VPHAPEAPAPDDNRARFVAHLAREQRRRDAHDAVIAARKAGATAITPTRA
jgi:hypothetical protein